MITFTTTRELRLSHRIAQLLADSLERKNLAPVGLFSGRAGVCLALLEHGVRANNRVALEAATAHLHDLIGSLESTDIDASLGSGLAGIAYVVRRAAALAAERFPDAQQWLETLDQVLIECVDGTQSADAIDLVVGLAGIGTYACQSSEDRGVELADAVLRQLERRVTRDAAGCYWKDAVPLSQIGSAHAAVDLGVAHGVPGIIYCLAHLARFPTLTNRARVLANDSIRWLCNQALMASPTATFGYWVGGQEQARLAWCYGDVGIACVLAYCSARFENPALAGLARSLAEGAVSESRIVAAQMGWDVCHGSAGLALMYSRLAKRYAHDNLLAASDYWRERTLCAVEAALDTCDFLRPASPSTLTDSANGGASVDLLNGLSGVLCVLDDVALATVSCRTGHTWHDCFVP